MSRASSSLLSLAQHPLPFYGDETCLGGRSHIGGGHIDFNGRLIWACGRLRHQAFGLLPGGGDATTISPAMPATLARQSGKSAAAFFTIVDKARVGISFRACEGARNSVGGRFLPLRSAKIAESGGFKSAD